MPIYKSALIPMLATLPILDLSRVGVQVHGLNDLATVGEEEYTSGVDVGRVSTTIARAAVELLSIVGHNMRDSEGVLDNVDGGEAAVGMLGNQVMVNRV